MRQGKQFEIIEHLIRTGHITSFEQIFQYLYRSHVYKKMGINSQRFARLLRRPSDFKLREINLLANYFKVSPMTLLALIYGVGPEISLPAPTKPLKGRLQGCICQSGT